MSAKSRVLVVDDDASVGKVLSAILAQAGCESLHAESVDRALQVLRTMSIDLVISDLRMPGTDGFGMLEQLRKQWPDVPLIMLTAHGTVQIAVAAMRGGAVDFMLKPFEREEVVATVQRALDATAARRQEPPRLPQIGEGFFGSSAALAELVQRLERAASGSATVLLRGESGTGKELAAKLIHARSERAGKPFVVVDLGAIPDNLMESELFGHEKGAFTGAVQRKPGRVELAAGGTLFLDEVGETPLAMQVKLLRLLQEREYRPLGGTASRRADVRFIAATHRDLESMVADGTFRQDLYYRLSVLPIRLPPLRERPDDVVPLARHFCELFARDNQRPGLRLHPDACAALARHSWPGNVRELQNAIERLVVMSASDLVGAVDVERELSRTACEPAPARVDPRPGTPLNLEARVQEAEREAVATAILKAGGNRTVAARILGISRRSLYNKMAEYGLD